MHLWIQLITVESTLWQLSMPLGRSDGPFSPEADTYPSKLIEVAMSIGELSCRVLLPDTPAAMQIPLGYLNPPMWWTHAAVS